MAIIGFTYDRNNIPANAVITSVSDARSSMSADTYGPRPMWCYATQIGKCLAERESNGSYDSDFYMTYWDDSKQKPVTVMFATTRGWTYPALASSVDATSDVRAKYQVWGIMQQNQMCVEKRKVTASKKRELRNRIKAIAVENNVNYPRLLKLRKHSQFEGMVALFGKRIRNGFRLNMRQQLINWLNGQSSYDQPFSKKQLQYI